uniref:Uncharacterized protein n=1 Tax=Rhizophora mucronata TaxID=61149 RepID=A0A2P2QL11_RHIMU
MEALNFQITPPKFCEKRITKTKVGEEGKARVEFHQQIKETIIISNPKTAKSKPR